MRLGPPPPERYPVGTPAWQRRYDTLIKEGFSDSEASLFASYRIGTPAIVRGRKMRKKWFAKLVERLGRVPSPEELQEKYIRELYDRYDWMTYHDQFYVRPATEE